MNINEVMVILTVMVTIGDGGKIGAADKEKPTRATN